MCILDEQLAAHGIVVDAFHEKAEHAHLKHFFLTHAHWDHVRNLHQKYLKNGVTLWCHTVTWQLTSITHPQIQLAKHQSLSYNQWTRVNRDVEVCAIPAHHCDGSAMFLFRCGTETILYTGDFRFVREPLLLEIRPNRMYLDDSLWDLQLELPSLEQTYRDFQSLLKTLLAKHSALYIHTGAIGAEHMYRQFTQDSGLQWSLDPMIENTFRGKQLKLLMPDCITSQSSGLILSNIMKRGSLKGETWVVPTCQPRAYCSKHRTVPNVHPLFFCSHANRSEIERLIALVAADKVIRCGHAQKTFVCAEDKSPPDHAT